MSKAAQLLVVIAVGAMCFPVCDILAAEPDAASEAKINEALRSREYDQAVTLINQALDDAADGVRETLLFRRGLAEFYAGRHEQAISTFKEQLAAFSAGPWAHKARLRMADAHAALRQFEAAERIYAQRIHELVGDARKSRIAEIYIEFANEYFKPTDALTTPSYRKALGFYKRALSLEPGESLRGELRYKQGLCYQKLEMWRFAVQAYREYLLAFDERYRFHRKMLDADAPLPPASEKPGKYIVQVRLGLGETLLASAQYTDARRELQDLISLIEAEPAEREERAETLIKATYQLAKTYQIPTPPDAVSMEMGVETLMKLLEQYPASKEAINAAHDIGASYAQLGRYDKAIKAFEALLNRDMIRPGDDETRKLAETKSQDALFSIGRLYYQQKKYADAIGVWNQYVAKYPSGPHWSDAQRRIVDAEYSIGFEAQNDDRYDDARQAWTTFLQKHPLDSRVCEILFAFGDMAYREQLKREEIGETPNWQEPIRHWRKLVNKFPDAEEAGRAQFNIGLIYERKIGDLKAAIETYRKLTSSSWSSKAVERIGEMNSVRLNLITERVFRTDEKAKVHVDVRNIDKLTVKLYRIDMEDYFRKSQTILGVDSLDLPLIDPDKTLEVEVDGYAKYKPIAQDVEIPFDGPGVYAVTVTNEQSEAEGKDGSAAKRLKATTLLVRSDIDLIIKTSREQLLVFAEDMLTQTPASGVKVLVSDGDKVILEGETGEDGAWLVASDKLKKADERSIFAWREGHIAGDRLSLGGLGFSTGLQPRGYIYTDRPAYRPGDAVSIRGVLREVRDGAYALPTQPEDKRLRWVLDVVDAQGRLLHSEEIVLTQFGSFATGFQIAKDASVGDYSLIARRADGPSFTSRFSVRTYQLAKAYISFDFDDSVVMRGQPIKGNVVAKYHYGEPLVNKEIAYRIMTPGGGSVSRSGKTDEEGKVPFTFETEMLPEESVVVFEARQDDLEIAAMAQVFVAVRAFKAEIETLRPLFLSEEPVEVKVKATDLKGTPIAQDMTVTAYLRTYAQGQWAETKVEASQLTTDKDSGVGRTSLNLVKGGAYVLRAEGKDQAGHLVSAETMVQVSDDKDGTRIRLFSDRQHYKVGETIDLDIHSRLEAAAKGKKEGVSAADLAESFLALITTEGEGIISYRTLMLNKGHNKLAMPVGNDLFPNAQISVAVMAGTGFHQASRGFTVERQLHVSIKTDKTTYRPRDEMTLELIVTDQQGAPVQGEIGLAMVDKALLAKYADDTPEIVDFFYGGAVRTTDSRSASTCAFRYVASTASMVTELLAEEERLEESREFAAKEFKLKELLITVPVLAEKGTDEAPAPAEASGVQMFRRGRAPGHAGFAHRQSARSVSPRKRGMRTNREGGLGGGRFIEGYVDDDEESEAESHNLSFGMSPGLQQVDRVIEQADLRGQIEQHIFSFSCGYFKGEEAVSVSDIGDGLASIIAAAPPRTYFPEVAYWNPRIVTDEAGRATVKIIMPDSSTQWRLMARGVTKLTLVGQGEAEVLSKSDFVAELLMPLSLVEGDSVRPRGQIHCLTPYAGKIDARLEIVPEGRDGERIVKETTIDVDGAGVYDVEFDLIDVPVCERLIASCSARTQSEVPAAGRPLGDAIAKKIPVRSWGLRVESHAAGIAKDNEFVEIELPNAAAADYHDIHLSIAVGADMQRWLIEEAVEDWPSPCVWEVVPPRSHADAASELLAALYAADYVRSQLAEAADASADMRTLNERIAALIAQLLAAQNEGGGWPWCGNEASSDPWTTAQVAWAIGKARRDGFPVADEAVIKLIADLRNRFADARTTQTELKAIVLHGLTWIDEVEFSHANRLYRNRESLSTAALTHLALTFVQLDRNRMAAELLEALDARMQEAPSGARVCRVVPAIGNSAWMNSDIEVTALTLLAQLHVDPRAPRVQQMVDYLTGQARAHGWRPHKAKGCILAALASYYGGAEQARADYTLAVRVNGETLRTLSSEDGGSIRIDVGGKDLGDGKQRVDFAFDGRGEYAYAVTLSGFSQTYPSPDQAKNGVVYAYPREILPPRLQYKGRIVPIGFSVVRDLGEEGRFHNTAENVPVGGVIDMKTRLRRFRRSDNEAGDRDYLIAQETIPAGFRLLTETLEGNHRAYDYANNVLTLYYGSRRDPGTLSYKMVATTEGRYRMPPTLIRSLYRPEIFHVNWAHHVLTVLPRGQKSSDSYRMSPDELYNLGRFFFDDQDYDKAAENLKGLLAGDWILEDKCYRESVRMLLSCALARNDNEAIVNYFEILKERHPELVIPFHEIVRVAAAYAATGQHEQAFTIYRATADASFSRDSRVGLALREEGRFLDSIDFLDDLWRDYPDTPQVTSVYFALSQSLYAKAEAPASIAPRRSNGSAARITRVSIIVEAIRLMESFLTLYPESPIADEASYSLANAYLDLDDFETVIARTKEFVTLFPKSKWLDRFRYMQALAYFNQSRFDEALSLAMQVSKATYRDAQGVTRPSPNKWLALYIVGQIYDAQSKTDKAIEFYEKVKERFSDAADAVNYFQLKFVSLPEVTIFHPDERGYRDSEEWERRLRARTPVAAADAANGREISPLYAQPFVKIDYRNIKSAVLQVYRVDLMKLALVEKNLNEITSVNLAGIKPIVEKTVTLGDGRDYVDKTERVSLALADDNKPSDGAYLVICRGDNLFSSGLILVTPLAVRVQEDPSSERVRVSVVNALSRGGEKNVHVKVIGSWMSRFITGETDLRGVFVADGVSGYPTAIARDAQGRFAFYRSAAALLDDGVDEDDDEALPSQRLTRQERSQSQGKKADYRSNLQSDNLNIQKRNDFLLEQVFEDEEDGVQVQKAQ